MRCQMTSICSGRGFIFVGDDFGRIHFVNRRMEVQTIKLFEGSVEQITQVCIKEDWIEKSVEKISPVPKLYCDVIMIFFIY